MAITVSKNTSYGPPLVNQKYAPLENIDAQAVDRPIYTGLLNNRFNLLRTTGLRAGGLDLALPDWTTALTNERAVGRLAPLVVVSSNRAGWIKKGLDAAATQLVALNLAAFGDECDLRALKASAGQTVSPPLYAPLRIGANRGVYIVVHMAEYTFYKTVLAGTNITPVGWQFQHGASGPRGIELVGFGATRFAAMEFCKQLYSNTNPAPNNVHAPWTRAWLLDDNVVAVTAFPGFALIEGAAAVGDVVSGFSGASDADAQSANKLWAGSEVTAGRNVPQPLKPSVTPGLVQQAALWNVQYFANNHLNFSPSYVASAEDLSISRYFDIQNIAYKFYKGNTVVKELACLDNKRAGQNVFKARAKLTSWFAAAESASPPTAPPPPVNVLPRPEDNDGGEQTLATFIVQRVLPNSGQPEKRNDIATQETAKCQAVEQLTCAGIEAGYATAALANTFQINGANNQVVTRQDVP